MTCNQLILGNNAVLIFSFVQKQCKIIFDTFWLTLKSCVHIFCYSRALHYHDVKTLTDGRIHVQPIFIFQKRYLVQNCVTFHVTLNFEQCIHLFCLCISPLFSVIVYNYFLIDRVTMGVQLAKPNRQPRQKSRN